MREHVRDYERLEHMLEAINRILSFAESKSKKEMEIDDIQYYGIVKNIEIIGEASYKLTQAFRNQHPETPWSFITRMRHILVHDYYQVSPKEIWKVVNEDLPILREQIMDYIANTDWMAWNKNETVIVETTTTKSLGQTARRMKAKGISIADIAEITNLPVEEIERL